MNKCEILSRFIGDAEWLLVGELYHHEFMHFYTLKINLIVCFKKSWIIFSRYLNKFYYCYSPEKKIENENADENLIDRRHLNKKIHKSLNLSIFFAHLWVNDWLYSKNFYSS